MLIEIDTLDLIPHSYSPNSPLNPEFFSAQGRMSRFELGVTDPETSIGEGARNKTHKALHLAAIFL